VPELRGCGARIFPECRLERALGIKPFIVHDFKNGKLFTYRPGHQPLGLLDPVMIDEIKKNSD